jgi:hypothetical protein
MDKNPPKPLDPVEVRDQEAKTPEIIRFLRELTNPGSPAVEGVKDHVNHYLSMENAILEATAQRVPGGLVLVLLAELREQEYQDGIKTCMMQPNRDEHIRKYIKAHFGNKGIHFEFKKDGPGE